MSTGPISSTGFGGKGPGLWGRQLMPVSSCSPLPELMLTVHSGAVCQPPHWLIDCRCVYLKVVRDTSSQLTTPVSCAIQGLVNREGPRSLVCPPHWMSGHTRYLLNSSHSYLTDKIKCRLGCKIQSQVVTWGGSWTYSRVWSTVHPSWYHSYPTLNHTFKENECLHIILAAAPTKMLCASTFKYLYK